MRALAQVVRHHRFSKLFLPTLKEESVATHVTQINILIQTKSAKSVAQVAKAAMEQEAPRVLHVFPQPQNFCTKDSA